MLRFLLRYLMNNEKLISKLADSRPMRRAAQFVVYLLSRTGSIAKAHKLTSDPKEFAIQFKNIAEKFAKNVKSSIENSKQMKKK